MKKTFYAIPFLLLMLVSCAPRIYKTPDFDSVTAKHKTVAILPADVSIQLRPREMKNTSEEQFRKMLEQTGTNIQDKMYAWFLNRSNRFKYTVSFQDVARTNALLSQAGITSSNINTKTKDELAQLLGVDAVISIKTNMEKPMSEGAALAAGILVGAWGNTNQVQTTIAINEAKKGELVWKYDHSASGSVGSSTDNLVNNLMRNASRKFPYNGK